MPMRLWPVLTGRRPGGQLSAGGRGGRGGGSGGGFSDAVSSGAGLVGLIGHLAGVVALVLPGRVSVVMVWPALA